MKTIGSESLKCLQYVIAACIISLLGCIIYELATEPIYIWDEAIYANNALEMSVNKNYGTYTYNGLTNHYNSKPPFVLWLQAFSMQLFGFHEFALRLPSLLALLGILVAFYKFNFRYKISHLATLLGIFILLTCSGAIRPHVFLSGDLDAMLVLFTTLLILIHLHQIQTLQITSNSILFMSLIFVFGFITKSFAVYLLLPAFIISYAKAGMLKPLFQQKYLYFGIAINIVLIIFYYGIREYFDTGYFSTVYNSEIKRYWMNVMDWHTQPFLFYVKNIVLRFNTIYFIISLLVALPFFLNKEGKNKNIVLHAFIIILVYILTISIPSVKLEWYDAPIYPIWSLALGMMLYDLAIPYYMRKKSKLITIAISIICIGLLCWQTFDFCKSNMLTNRTYAPQEIESAALKSIDKKYHKKKYIVLTDVEDNKYEHFAVLDFYTKAMYLQSGTMIELRRYVHSIHSGDTIIVCQQNKIDSLKTRFKVSNIDSTWTTLASNYFVVIR